jgi:hypothetical protein
MHLMANWPRPPILICHNTALTLDVAGEKTVVTLIVGNPDLSRLPLIINKDYMTWNGDPIAVAKRLVEMVRSGQSAKRGTSHAAGSTTGPSVPTVVRADPGGRVADKRSSRRWLRGLLGR